MIPEVRWVDPASLHLTLAFLGELDDARFEAATQTARPVAGVHAPFTLRLAGLGTFGSARSPRVIWVGLAGEKARLLALRAALTDDLAARGFPREERPFSPHLTLARIKTPLTDDALTVLARALHEPAPDVTWRAEAIAVMKSELYVPPPAIPRSPAGRWRCPDTSRRCDLSRQCPAASDRMCRT